MSTLLIQEYRGMEAPDQYADPISFHLWFEANQCSSCAGSGHAIPESCAQLERWNFNPPLCETCDGSGFRPGVFE